MQDVDQAARTERITALAERVFGDREKTASWLNKQKQQFGGRTPIQMLETEDGERVVEEALIRIDEGMFA
jgi:putative toxin-antitoxin system antitoxin component (TIGR02293 family)